MKFYFPLSQVCEPEHRFQGPLRVEGWEKWLSTYPNAGYRNTLLDIITYVANIG